MKRLVRLLSSWPRGRAASSSSSSSASSSAAAAPSHHRPGGGFRNPPEWRSSRDQGLLDFFRKALPHWDRNVRYAPQPVERVDFAALEAHARARAPPLLACWLGHVTFLVQSHGLRVLTDPLFSARASPVSFAGPKRFTPAAAQAAELPQPLDAVVVSHAHYDHLDEASVRALLALRAPPRSWVVPLGLGAILRAWGAPAERVHERDWYGSVNIARDGGRLRVTVVPAQHGSARTPFDKDATLWCGFYLRFSSSSGEGGGGGGKTAFFAGDTGYRTVEQGDARGSAAEEAAPRCPAFREMRERLGAPDLALLPIGAYSPRGFMSSVHASPEDAVLMFEDLGARRAVAMHWGALPLTDEPVDAPPARLAAELERRGHRSDAFVALRCGATWREQED
jgi:N-acyl-phosphatidylethanolamine-hydrolysing phospholipase D